MSIKKGISVSRIFNDRENIRLISTDSKDGLTVEVFEYTRLTPPTVNLGLQQHFAFKEGLRLRQCVVILDGTQGVQLSPGAMSYTLGDINMHTNVKSTGDFMKKLVTAHVTRESAVKPLYTGRGEVGLEPSFRNYLVAELNKESYCMDDGLFYAASERIQITAKMNRLSMALAGGEGGLFQLMAAGTGLLVIESRFPMAEISVVELNDETLVVDGNQAILWSADLQYTVEKSSKSLIGSAASGEGLVNVFRGSGVVWLATTQKING